MPPEQSALAIRPEDEPAFDPDATKVRTLTRQNIEELIAAAEFSNSGIREPRESGKGHAAGTSGDQQHAVPAPAMSGIRELDEADLEEDPDTTLREGQDWELPITVEGETLADTPAFGLPAVHERRPTREVHEVHETHEQLDRDGRVAPEEQLHAMSSVPPFARQSIAPGEVAVFIAAFVSVAGPAFYWLMR